MGCVLVTGVEGENTGGGKSSNSLSLYTLNITVKDLSFTLVTIKLFQIKLAIDLMIDGEKNI